jgi:hypothetical protein
LEFASSFVLRISNLVSSGFINPIARLPVYFRNHVYACGSMPVRVFKWEGF